MNLYITLDVDPDFENPGRGVEGALRGIERCLKLFREYSIEERVTWLVNDTELRLTRRHEEWLAAMGEGEIGLHLHLNRTRWSGSGCSLPRDAGAVLRAVEQEKERLEAWVERHLGRRVVSYRSGNLMSSRVLFRALEEAGIRVDSSLPAQFDWSPREVGRKVLSMLPERLHPWLCRRVGFIYPTLPVGAKPRWIGGVLEMPLHVYAGGRYLRESCTWVLRRTREHLDRGVTELVVYWHPHEALTRERQLAEYLEHLLDMGMTPRRLGDAEDILA